MNGIQKVSGSIPLISTTHLIHHICSMWFFLFTLLTAISDSLDSMRHFVPLKSVYLCNFRNEIDILGNMLIHTGTDSKEERRILYHIPKIRLKSNAWTPVQRRSSFLILRFGFDLYYSCGDVLLRPRSAVMTRSSFGSLPPVVR